MRHAKAAALAALLIPLAGLAGTAPAASQDGQEGPAERPLVLQTEGLQPGERFRCTIPVDLHYEGENPPERISIIAGAYAGPDRLGSTGLTPESRPLVAEWQGLEKDYEQIPLQFELASGQCRQVDGLRIDFARCRLEGGGPAEPCRQLMRFADAPADDPLYLPLAKAEP